MRIPADLEDAGFDLIVVGAGINGAGIARDAAMRGLKVLLLDKGDIAAGTTSWSSRLIHGGLRYLEHAEVGLVRESLRERERLLRIAPHLVKPLPLLIPIFRRNKRGPWMIRTGMVAYDVLSFDKSLDRHRTLSRDQALVRAPGLRAHDLRSAAVYYDAQVEYPERLSLENALSARAHGAVVLTYARVDRLLMDGSTVRGVEFSDLIRGGTHSVRAAVTINVAGPWVDQVLAGLDGTVPRMIGGTKGSHIVVEPFPGAPRDALYVEAEQDGRAYFIIPWNDLYLIGTTDIRFAGDLDHVEADEAEIDYLLRETNLLIPLAGLNRASVLYAYAGIRPLPFQVGGSEASITRRHIVHDHAPKVDGLVSIVGGKLTTYRNLAAQSVDCVQQKLGRQRSPSRTGRTPLPGAGIDFTGFAERFMADAPDWLPVNSREHLLRVYGARATEVVRLALENDDLRAQFDEQTGAIGAEIVMAFRCEMAETLADAMLRRTMVGLGPTAGFGADEAAISVAQKHLGWDEERASGELANYRDYIERFRPRNYAARGREERGARSGNGERNIGRLPPPRSCREGKDGAAGGVAGAGGASGDGCVGVRGGARHGRQYEHSGFG